MPRRNYMYPLYLDKAADPIVKQLMEEGKPTVPQDVLVKCAGHSEQSAGS